MVQCLVVICCRITLEVKSQKKSHAVKARVKTNGGLIISAVLQNYHIWPKLGNIQEINTGDMTVEWKTHIEQSGIRSLKYRRVAYNRDIYSREQRPP